MKKTAVPGFYKKGDGVVLNQDSISLKNYKAKKEKDRKINMLEEKVNNMGDDLKTIKELLQRLVN